MVAKKHRESAVCQFCDTDFVGIDGVNGGNYSAIQLAQTVMEIWGSSANKLIVFTGGEPMLQLDEALIKACQQNGFETAIETNGTLSIDFHIDWICVSPKEGSELIIKNGNELKVVFPQPGQNLKALSNLKFEHLFLQPMDGEQVKNNTAKTIQYCLENPEWKLSIQQHKLIGMP